MFAHSSECLTGAAREYVVSAFVVAIGVSGVAIGGKADMPFCNARVRF